MAVHTNEREKGEGNENRKDNENAFQDSYIRPGTGFNKQRAPCCNCRNLSNLQKTLIAILLIIGLAACICIVVFFPKKLPSDACIGGERCQNGGTCVSGPNNNNHNNSCVCAQGYEGQVCATVTNNCAHNPCFNGGTCKNEIGSFSCICLDEFAGDTCEKLNECRYRFTCAPPSPYDDCYRCRDGFVKDPEDDTRCKYGTTNRSLIISSKSDMRMILLDAPNTTQIIPNTDHVKSTDYNFQTNTIFWFSDSDRKIYTAQLNGEYDKKSITLDTRSDIVGLSVDWIHQHLYWLDWGEEEICVSNFDGTMKKVLFDNELEWPTSLAVNPLNGWMYWSDKKTRIERAGLDGSQREAILSTNIDNPRGLVVDLVDWRLYWCQGANPGSIWSSEFDGSDPKLIFTPNIHRLSSSGLLDIATFDKYIYFLEDSDTIYKIDKCDVTELEMIYNSSKPDLTDIDIFDGAMQPEGENLCSKRIDQCSHFCFPVPSPSNGSVTTTTCACPDGLSLAVDKLNCV